MSPYCITCDGWPCYCGRGGADARDRTQAASAGVSPDLSEKLARLWSLIANLAHPRGDHRENPLEDEAHDILRELRIGLRADTGEAMNETFAKELESLLNRHCVENASNTPDFILAQYLLGCLAAWNTAVQQRETWYGRDASPTAQTQEPTT